MSYHPSAEFRTHPQGFIDDYWCGHGVLPHPSFFPLLHSGQIQGIKGEIKEVKDKSLVLKSGKEIPCDLPEFDCNSVNWRNWS